MWAPHHLEPRTRRRQSGGIAPCKGATRRRHAVRGLRMAQNPHRYQCRARCRGRGPGWGAGGWRKPGNCTHHQVPRETNLAQHEPHGPTSGTKLSQHTPSHRMCGTKLSQHAPSHRMCGIKLSLHARPRRISGIKLSLHAPSHRMCGTKLSQHDSHGPTSGTKLSLLTRNGSIWRFFDMQGEFCTVLTTKKPSRENFVPNARQRRGSPTQQHTRPHLCGGCRRDRCGGCRRDRCGGHRRDRRARAGFEAQSLAAVPVGGGGARPQYLAWSGFVDRVF